ncbi:MAG TPA: flagellar motor protein MotB [Dissulfurispiraceae bacterium]|nr:flagellar motor protein MotB [Dissulfurispiraceae bacterium]
MADKSKTIIVRKIKKSHGDSHGGSWKVAYADFVTAMMAFFLLLWLISMVTPEKKAVLADYFRNFNVFSQGGRSFMEQSSSIQKEIKTSAQEVVTGELSAEDLKQKFKAAIEDKLKNLKDQVLLDVVEGGVRIQIVDLEGSPMFPSGSAEPNEKCRQILKVVSENIRETGNRIAVEGHTDSTPFRRGGLTNWELSTGRASSARKELENDGVDTGRIARVVGYADTELLVKDNPKDPKNRRISIILLSGNKSSQQAPEPPKNTAESAPAQPLQILQPSAQPVQPPAPAPAAETTDTQRTKKGEDRWGTDKDGKKIVDPGIKPVKPIEMRPSIFPGLER